MRVSFLDETTHGVVTVDFPNTCICPSAGVNLVGNDAGRLGITFDNATGRLTLPTSSPGSYAQAELQNDLFKVPCIIHTKGGSQAPGRSRLAMAFNEANASNDAAPSAHTTPTNAHHTTLAQYCGGIGHVTHALGPAFRTLAYCEDDDDSAATYAASFPHTTIYDSSDMHGDTHVTPNTFTHAARLADMGVYGSTCEGGDTAQFQWLLTQIRNTRHKVVVAGCSNAILVNDGVWD